mgnify:CR=1 FL=1
MSSNDHTALLGRVLGHSYTPVIYRELAGLDYRKFEREPDQLEDFVRSDVWEGFNVTIPYKKKLVPYMANYPMSPNAWVTSNGNAPRGRASSRRQHRLLRISRCS